MTSLALVINLTTWLFHAGSFEYLCLSKSMSCVVQMGKDTILPFEKIFIFIDRLLIVWIKIDWIWTCQVSDLSYTQLTVAYLFVQKTWFHFVRVNIGISSDDIMMDTASIV